MIAFSPHVFIECGSVVIFSAPCCTCYLESAFSRYTMGSPSLAILDHSRLFIYSIIFYLPKVGYISGHRILSVVSEQGKTRRVSHTLSPYAEKGPCTQ